MPITATGPPDLQENFESLFKTSNYSFLASKPAALLMQRIIFMGTNPTTRDRRTLARQLTNHADRKNHHSGGRINLRSAEFGSLDNERNHEKAKFQEMEMKSSLAIIAMAFAVSCSKPDPKMQNKIHSIDPSTITEVKVQWMASSFRLGMKQSRAVFRCVQDIAQSSKKTLRLCS